MQMTVNGKETVYIRDALSEPDRREGYLELAKNVFGLDFSPWLRPGYPDGSFIPHTLYDGRTAVASVGIVANNFRFENHVRKYAQISTVMTHPDHRGQGLCDALMKRVLAEWENSCDMIYLYANDSVVDFYPKYSFIKGLEYRYSKPVVKQPVPYRKLNLQNPADADLLTEKYTAFNNPFSALQMEQGLSQMMFHCVTFLQDQLYYIEQYDAVVIAEHEDNHIFCYDIFTKQADSFDAIIGALAADSTVSVRLGFTPRDKKSFMAEESREDNTTVFVHKKADSPFHTHQVTFPFLSRA